MSELIRDKRFKGMEEQLRSGWGALLKPLAWQGALCYGPSRSSKVTFTNPASFLKNWNGLPDPVEAAPAVIKRYLSVYGPATPETFDAWLSRNSNKKSTLKGWFASLGEQIVEVRVKDETRYLLAEHEDELAATQPSRATHGKLVVTPFPGEQAPPSKALEDAAARLAAVHGLAKLTPRVG